MGYFDNPQDVANKYLKQIPGVINKYFKPYLTAGQETMPLYANQTKRLLEQPGQAINEIGQDFKQSPGYKFMLDQALQGSGHAAAAGGMAGSPMHEQMNQEIATQLANQEYNQWLEHALKMYGLGYGGAGDISHLGAGVAQSGADMEATNLTNQANIAAQQAAARQKAWQQALGAGIGVATGNPFSI